MYRLDVSSRVLFSSCIIDRRSKVYHRLLKISIIELTKKSAGIFENFTISLSGRLPIHFQEGAPTRSLVGFGNNSNVFATTLFRVEVLRMEESSLMIKNTVIQVHFSVKETYYETCKKTKNQIKTSRMQVTNHGKHDVYQLMLTTRKLVY